MRNPTLFLLAAAAVLGACDGDPDAAPAEPPATSPRAAFFASRGDAPPAIVLTQGGVVDAVSKQITTYAFSINTGDTVVLETQNCSDGADPVMHLFVAGAEVSRNDNGG